MNVLNKLYVSPAVARWLAFLWAILVLYTSSRPSPKVMGFNQSLLDHVLDFAHLPVYFVLTVLLIRSWDSLKIRFLIWSFFIAAFWGILNEYVQLMVPGRSFSFKDMLMNIAGALLAILVLLAFRKKCS